MVEQGRGPAISGHHLEDFRDARRATFRQIKLFQEFTDAPIAPGKVASQIDQPLLVAMTRAFYSSSGIR
jgi:hypothetical protein